MKKLILAAIVAIAMPASAADTRYTKMECAPSETLFNMLKKDFKEIPYIIATGADGDHKGNVVSVWVNKLTKTTSVVITLVGRKESCLIIDGKDLKILDELSIDTQPRT